MSEDGCKPIFKTVQKENKAKSQEAGRPIFEDREYVEIIIPGSKNERPIRPVRDEDKERWPDEYRRFKEGQEMAKDGTPLEQWPRMTRSRVYELKAVGVFSVEDLASLADSNLSNVGPDARELRESAQEFLSGGNFQVREMKEYIATLEDRVARLEKENRELHENQKKKPGPKPEGKQSDGEKDKDRFEESRRKTELAEEAVENHKTKKEAAESLGISVNTLNSHLRNRIRINTMTEAA